MNSLFLLPKTLAFAPNPSSSSSSKPNSHSSSATGIPITSSSRRGNPLKPSLLEQTPLLRLWLHDCCHLLISSVIGLSCALSLHPAVADAIRPQIPSVYPCEDVDSYYNGVWDALKILDAVDVENPEASSEIIEIYSLRAVPKSLAGKPEGWNREHLWPRSYGLRDGTSLTDLHNIRPADVNVNSSRRNKYYGECVSVSTHCSRPANNEAASDTETDKERWAPPRQVRGDIARSLMYMAVSYGFQQPDGRLPLLLSDSPNIEKHEMGLLSTLLQWNKLDPPSRMEQLRNDRICKLYQHNRNPFIDHPEYANFIWKNVTSSNLTAQHPNLKAGINEFHYDNEGKNHNEFIEILPSPSANAAELKLILYNGSTGRMYKSLSREGKQIFNVNIDASGYLIYAANTTLRSGPADGLALVSVSER
ncbi:Endonuclease I [Musa troglodytarum]|uniref:Endonuclease I n=1 Tax=Musa troglodytarum TaxID=320322 RepID=A0A9E7F960_9LILI|nr:Endonuclease I [Musa troglodytarum]